MTGLSIAEIGTTFLLKPDLDAALAGELSLDVLHVTGALSWSWPLPRWFIEKTSRWTRRLQQLDINARALVPQALMPGCTRDNLIDFIALVQPSIVVSRSFCLRGRDLEALSHLCPRTIFLQSNHTPNSFMLQADDSSPSGWLESLEAARTNAQVYLSTVSKFDSESLAPLAPSGKLIWMPNPCDDGLIRSAPDLERSGREDHVPTIALAGRTNFQKNLKNQIDAVALVAQKRRLKFELMLGHDVMPGMREALRNYAQQLLGRLVDRVTVTEFVPPDVLAERASRDFDVFLQVTFDESFGYLNWEMMAAGVPTITPSNIQVPGSATADPVRIASIATEIEKVLDAPQNYRMRSLEQARTVAADNNAHFAAAVSHLSKARARLVAQ